MAAEEGQSKRSATGHTKRQAALKRFSLCFRSTPGGAAPILPGHRYREPTTLQASWLQRARTEREEDGSMQVKQLPELQGQKRLAVVFGSGEEMIGGLADLTKIRSIAGAYFTGIGALRAAMLGFFDIARREYRRFGIDEQVEVLSLTGNIALEEGEPRIHAHYRGGALQRRHPGRSSPRSARAAHPSR